MIKIKRYSLLIVGVFITSTVMSGELRDYSLPSERYININELRGGADNEYFGRLNSSDRTNSKYLEQNRLKVLLKKNVEKYSIIELKELKESYTGRRDNSKSNGDHRQAGFFSEMNGIVSDELIKRMGE